MKHDRLRRALLPTWPPDNVSEAMLLLFCAAALRLLLGLWVAPAGTMLPQPGLADAALVMLAETMRPLALGLLLALAARVMLGVTPGLALGLGALLMAGTWAAVLIQGPGGLAPARSLWLEPLCVAVLAPVAARLAGGRARPGILLAPVAGGLVAAVTHYDMLHGWVLDALGLSVRGALIFGLEHARRGGLDAVPLMAACLVGWLVAGGGRLRRTLLLPWSGRAWPVAVAGMACVTWGYLRTGVALGALPAILQPPSIYGLVAFLAGLGAMLALIGQVRAHRRNGAPRPSAHDLGLLAAWALGLTFLAGTAALILALVIALLLVLPLLARPGTRADRPTGLLGGAAMAALLWMAGAAVAPGVGLAWVPLDGLLLPGLLAAGAGFVGLQAPDTRRPVAALRIVLLCAGLAALVLEAGRAEMMVLWAIMFLLLELSLLLPRRAAPLAGDAAIGCLSLLVVATVLSVP